MATMDVKGLMLATNYNDFLIDVAATLLVKTAAAVELLRHNVVDNYRDCQWQKTDAYNTNQFCLLVRAVERSWRRWAVGNSLSVVR